MPRPTQSLPIQKIISCGHDVALWYERHQPMLSKILGPRFDGKAITHALTHELEEAQDSFSREQNEDISATNTRQSLINSSQKFVSSALGFVRVVFFEDPNLKDLLRTISKHSPSKLVSLDQCQTAVRQALKALHSLSVDAPYQPIFNELITSALHLPQDLDNISQTTVQETLETAQAKKLRDDQRDALITLFKRLQFAAQSIVFLSPEPLDELQRIFDIYTTTRQKHASPQTPSDPQDSNP